MKEYILQNVEYNSNKFYLICLSHNSLLCYQSQIENELATKNGQIIIDQLLITGNNRNRFLTCTVRNGKLILSTAYVSNGDGPYKFLTSEYLRQNVDLLYASALTDLQKKLIIKGCVI